MRASASSHHGRGYRDPGDHIVHGVIIVQRCRPMRYSRTAGTEATADGLKKWVSLRISSRISVEAHHDLLVDVQKPNTRASP